MSYLRTFLLFVVLCFASYSATSQLIAGFNCDPNSPDNPAPIICSLDTLDGFMATMPVDSAGVVPEFLCATGGVPNNMSWFAFVAGGNVVDLTITPTNCTFQTYPNGDPVPSSIGIQTGIYSSCDFTNENIVVCHNDCETNQDSPVNLYSDQYIPGQVYYLFVDGCGGSVCDYLVSVNEGEQAFEMPEITTISNEFNYDLSEDTICKGAEIAFRLDGLDLDVDFSWSINPPTSVYPTGMHPVTDTNTVSFVFADEGTFEIVVYAFNDCDASESDTFQVVVQAIEDEIFTDVALCQECIIEGITLVTPDAGCIIGAPLILTEDPNGDGLPGWQGTMQVTSSGLDSNLVTNAIGCYYNQYVNIVEIPLGEREIVDLYYCFTEFPVTYNGIVFNSPGDSRNITIDNAAASGCDSLVRITANAVDLIGNTSLSDCQSGMITITYNIIDVMPADYDSITFIWYDAVGNEISDSDGLDNTLVVLNPGSYSTSITVHKNGVACLQTYGPFNVDADNLIPETPSIAFAPVDVCVSEGVATIYVNNQNLGENYVWSLTPNLPFAFGGTNDTLIVDITSGESFEFCVMATNGCGTSDQFCDDVLVSEVPNSTFTINNEVCLDSTLIVTYTGGDGTTSNTSFMWDFSGATVTNGADLLGPGPFELQFANTGMFDISLVLFENGCNSMIYQESVLVSDGFIAPVVDCVQGSGSVTFGFDDNDVENFEVFVITGQSYEIVGTDSIRVTGLGTEESVSIEITFNENDICGAQFATAECTSLACPTIDFEISLGNQNQCIDDEERNIELAISVIGNDSGIGSWDSPFVYESNLFNVLMAGPGEHIVTYNYEVMGCMYSIDTTIYLHSSPNLEFVLDHQYCNDDVTAILDVMALDFNLLTLNGDLLTTTENIELSQSGNYEIIASNIEGCETIVSFDLISSTIEPLTITGKEDLIIGNSYNYSVNNLGDLPNLAYTWILGSDTICIDCIEIQIDIEEDQTLCAIASYGEDCQDEACIDLLAVEDIEIYSPNIFSPNGDQVNDVFSFQSNNPNTMIESLVVFDRWGEMMFSEKEFIFNEDAMSWDGEFNGSPCSPGVYIYVIRYKNLEGTLIEKAGDITLIR